MVKIFFGDLKKPLAWLPMKSLAARHHRCRAPAVVLSKRGEGKKMLLGNPAQHHHQQAVRRKIQAGEGWYDRAGGLFGLAGEIRQKTR
jgi:hypothetical protein